jgi:hypothetical protein
VALCLTAAVLSVTAGVARAADDVSIAPINAVVLIDESGSQTRGSVENERDAAALLAQSELSPKSKIQIAGFGSSNGPGQSAVVPYCKWITLSSAEARDEAARCAARAHRRKPGEGDDTDHVAALSYAVDQLSRTGAEATPVIFLMTDGLLDVCRSPQYGRTCASRGRNANRQLTFDVLPRARRLRIQIWPLGFGTRENVRTAPLERFASGGGGANIHCDTYGAARPHAVVVGDSSRVLDRLLGLLGRARCAHVNGSSRGDVDDRGTTTLKVTIPAIATDGSLSVSKLDPTLRVSYYQPDGKQAPSSGVVDDQTFSLSGQNDRIEALRIQNPKPGTWKVKVENPAHHRRRSVSATAIWAGALEAAIAVRPNVPRPGGHGTVDVHLSTRYGAITDPSALTGLRASALVTGKFGSLSIAIHDDGKDPDQQAHDGTFSGNFSLPTGAGDCITVIGRIAGDGLAADRRPFYGCAPPGGIDAIFPSSWPEKVEEAGTISGALVVKNDNGPQVGRLTITVLSPKDYATIQPSSISLAQGKERYAFKIAVAPSTPHGELSGRVRLIGADGAVLGEAFLATRVVGKPPPPPLVPITIVLVVILLAAAILVARLRRRGRLARTRVDGLRASLLRDGQEMAEPVRAAGGHVFLLRYVPDAEGSRISSVLSAADADIQVRRLPDGRLTFSGLGRQEQIGLGEEVALDEHDVLLIQDGQSDLAPVQDLPGLSPNGLPGAVVGGYEDLDDPLA